MSKYYAVKKGRQTGVFLTWEECSQQVKGFKGAIFKSFSSHQEAMDFINDTPKPINQDGVIAYVDGSYNVKTQEYGYGCVIIHGQSIVEQINGKGSDPDYVSMRNVAGEIIASEMAIRYAIKHHYPLICIYYDYEGIEKWANGMWKANKQGTQAYQKFIKESRQQINIQFVKVLAHSGDVYNDVADKLAKKAVGIQ